MIRRAAPFLFQPKLAGEPPGRIPPVQDVINTFEFEAMAQRQQQLVDVILKDPDVASVSSFIGVYGINTTLNSGRVQINLKPRDDRDVSASDIIRRLQPQLANIQGISLFPRKGHAGRVSGTRELVVTGTPYIVAYRLEATAIQILSILHDARRWPESFTIG